MSLPSRWWENRWFLAVAILASSLPLLWPAIPPLTDFPGHVGRYHIASALPYSADLERHWTYEWAIVGNLGVDLIVYALAPLIGVEAAAKWTVVAIPPLTAAALTWLSYVAGGRVSPATLAAFPLTYSYAFIFGFVNSALSTAFAIAALALWIRMGQLRAFYLRAALFVPISFIIWVTHSFGWGLLGLFVFAAETVRIRKSGQPVWRALFFAGLFCIPLGGPALLMLPGEGASAPFYQWSGKIGWLLSLVRDQWKWLDVGAAIFLLSFLYIGLRSREWRFDPITGGAAVIGGLAFLLLPFGVATGAYTDMRALAPAIALGLVAMRPSLGREQWVAFVALAFFCVRTGAGMLSFYTVSEGHMKALEAVDHIPRGAAVAVLAQNNCGDTWWNNRYSHLAGIGIARRDIFENGQWTLAGQQLLRHRYPDAGSVASDPSQIINPLDCEFRPSDQDDVLQKLDRAMFTHVWSIGLPPRQALAPDVHQIWTNGVSTIYAIGSEASLSPTGMRQ